MAAGLRSNRNQTTTRQITAPATGPASDVTAPAGAITDAQIPSTIARDTEVTAEIAAHAGAADPHGDRAFATAAIATHAGLADPHTVYVLEGGTLVSVTALNALTFSATPTQAEVEALRAEVSSLLASLRVHA